MQVVGDDGCKLLNAAAMAAEAAVPTLFAQPKIHRTQEDDLNRHSKVKSCLTLIPRLLRE